MKNLSITLRGFFVPLCSTQNDETEKGDSRLRGNDVLMRSAYLKATINLMRYFIIALGLLLPFLSSAQKEIEYKTYSYSELYQMIEDEEDSIFLLNNAIIKPDYRTDSLHYAVSDRLGYDMETSGMTPFDNWPERGHIDINKQIKLNNVHFKTVEILSSEDQFSVIQTGIYKVNFLKHVEFSNTYSAYFNQANFQSGLEINNVQNISIEEAYEPYRDVFIEGQSYYSNSDFIFENCTINKSFNASFQPQESNTYILIMRNSIVQTKGELVNISLNNMRYDLNNIQFENFMVDFRDSYGSMRNSTVNRITALRFFGEGRHTILDNDFEDYVLFYKSNDPKLVLDIQWQQWFGKYVTASHLAYTPIELNAFDPLRVQRELLYNPSALEYFNDSVRVENIKAFKGSIRELASLYNEFKLNHDTENANLVYREIKNIETQRLAYLYRSAPSFDRFFSWKINQFLDIFSAYGTKPSRAIIISVYVILAFALVYLFFPNYWDSHGKNRIMDRYRFFTKYMNRDSGMHEVYLEEKNPELMASEDFKSYMLESEKGIPQFFMATALPLYRWSVAGTRTFSWMLSKVDVLKGKWSDTEDSKRGIKSVLLISAFLISLTYDIFIKVLNALMLSINTFTTLGFGEIPIKGLPRYLAIIQGFIGWFMLTIFSVSLISQLLN